MISVPAYGTPEGDALMPWVILIVAVVCVVPIVLVWLAPEDPDLQHYDRGPRGDRKRENRLLWLFRRWRTPNVDCRICDEERGCSREIGGVPKGGYRRVLVRSRAGRINWKGLNLRVFALVLGLVALSLTAVTVTLSVVEGEQFVTMWQNVVNTLESVANTAEKELETFAGRIEAMIRRLIESLPEEVNALVKKGTGVVWVGVVVMVAWWLITVRRKSHDSQD